MNDFPPHTKHTVLLDDSAPDAKRAERFDKSALHTKHTPVLLDEVIANLAPQAGHTYVDATFGGGGYSKRILDSADCRVVAIDRDPDAAIRAKEFDDNHRFSFIQTNFGNISSVLCGLNYSGVVFDFGVSSFQLEDGARGFSFMHEGPLDMRMSDSGETAADVVNTYSEEDLAQIIRTYGDEPFAAKISRAIVNKRKSQPILSTVELADVVRSVVRRVKMIDPATKTFQALRVFVNDELREIQLALDAIADDVFTRQLERVCVITVAFHSLEDRIVKNWWKSVEERERFRDNSSRPRELVDAASARSEPPCYVGKSKSRVIVPGKDELRANPRSR
ncbi:MAG: 16S rRNA (cytosine(1402)-N(4))-methyltransferase RsmH, partial [Holosporales bacterium]|nr:16S rRNA (cytosine(1402)-N(4))-methyltransferase RsmH [Holosporales bacterium]